MNIKPWMKKDLLPWMERLSDEELCICRTIYHRLSLEDRRRKAIIMEKVMDRDIFWGFLNDSWWSGIKRNIYIGIIHPILKVKR